MKKVLTGITYFTFVVACIAVMLIFITSKSYLQLGIAIALYPVIVLLGYRAFPRRQELPIMPAVALNQPPTNQFSSPTVSPADQNTSIPNLKIGTVDVADIDRRVFLKLVGATGLSFFLISMFSRRAADTLLTSRMNSNTTSTNPVDNNPVTTNQKSNPTGYTITEIDDSLVAYYGFTDQSGGWYIMREDTLAGSFRYAKGDSDFSKNWLARENLNYKYYHEIFN